MWTGPSCLSLTGKRRPLCSQSQRLTNAPPRGESGIGKWSVVVKDTNVNEHNGTFTDWKLTLWGECIDATNQPLLPMPTEHDDDDHTVISASPTFVSVEPGPSETATDFPANPTDHQHRPVNAKPTAPGATSTASSTALPDAPPDEDETDTHFLPHYFPTFGVSKRTQIWIYGALAIIVLFCAGLGTYFFIQRRKRRRNEREDYEFEMLDEEDAMLNDNGAVGGKRKGRRAGELYDAFAGESDEEQLLSESEKEDEEEYRDDGPASAEAGRGRSQSRQGEK